MADKKPKRPTYNTPVGIARYPHLNKPDTRFVTEGVYKVDLRIRMADAAEFIARLEQLRDEKFDSLEKAKQKTHTKREVFEVELDDEGEETGYVIIKTKLDAVGKSKEKGETWEQSPKLFDSQGNPLPSNVQIWGGSKLIVAGTINVYVNAKDKEVGVSLKCRGVQVIELVSGGGQTAESYGFKKQSGGYTTDAAKVGLGTSDSSDDAEDTGDNPPAEASGDNEEF